MSLDVKTLPSVVSELVKSNLTTELGGCDSMTKY